MKDVIGFVAEPHSNGYLVWPAMKKGDRVMCYDLAGFFGDWPMKAQGVFFECLTGDYKDKEAYDKALKYAEEQNIGIEVK